MKARIATECIILVALIGIPAAGWAADANRFTYLDESDPYYVSASFPKLLTPQWIGEPGVEAAIFLSIDDMRDADVYERYLRPILDRLKAIDGRAPVSILTCSIDPEEAQLQTWLREGLSIDVHTITHPCPLLGPEDFAWSKANVDDCVDMMSAIPKNRPVAFRMPCCDSKNTPSPRFFSEIFNGVSSNGSFLRIDSSVFNIATGTDRFRKYLPFPSFVNTIEDYPYPYVIGRLAWEFPCTVPSDWEAHNLHGSNNPRTIEDMKAAIDVSIQRQGIYTLVFHPHGWIRNNQIVELIDHVVDRYGSRVKFLTFREALERIEENLLYGNELRAQDGTDNGVRFMDLDKDGVMDVLIASKNRQMTRLWSTSHGQWHDSEFPTVLAKNPGVRFGRVRRGTMRR